MIKKLLLVAIIGAMPLALMDCVVDPPITDPADLQLEKLSATWGNPEVILDGVIQTGYGNFTLSITGIPGASSFGYTTTGRPSLSPWASSGTWIFGSDYMTEITRDPGSATSLPIAYAMSTDGSRLEMTFNYVLEGMPGRTSDVKGMWIFRFNKQ